MPKVPAAAVATEDCEKLAELLARGPVQVQLKLSCETLPDVPSANVVGELVGSERPDEIVVISGHLDSWDLGHGAQDDGAGCAHCLEAVRLLQAEGFRPKRTIRVVLWMNAGGFEPEGLTCSLRGAAFEAVAELMAPLRKHSMGALVAGGGGADIGQMRPFKVPLFGVIGTSHRYFDYHHSARDTLAAVHERELAMGAAALAYAASVMADYGERDWRSP